MSHFLYEIDAPDLDSLNPTIKKQAISSLESGKIVFFPRYTFALNQQEQHLMSPSIIDPKEKNISYDYQHQRLNGVAKDEDAHTMLTMMHRFAEFAKHAVTTTMPEYQLPPNGNQGSKNIKT
jgi:3-deoxy-D-manno-oct-2-ulosonic acid (Kdo) hydroxylase